MNIFKIYQQIGQIMIQLLSLQASLTDKLVKLQWIKRSNNNWKVWSQKCCVASTRRRIRAKVTKRAKKDSQSEGRPALVRPTQLSVTSEANSAKYISLQCNIFLILFNICFHAKYIWNIFYFCATNSALHYQHWSTANPPPYTIYCSVQCIEVCSIQCNTVFSAVHYSVYCSVQCSGNRTVISGLLLGRVRTIPKPLQHSFVLWWWWQLWRRWWQQ